MSEPSPSFPFALACDPAAPVCAALGMLAAGGRCPLPLRAMLLPLPLLLLLPKLSSAVSAGRPVLLPLPAPPLLAGAVLAAE